MILIFFFLSVFHKTNKFYFSKVGRDNITYILSLVERQSSFSWGEIGPFLSGPHWSHFCWMIYSQRGSGSRLYQPEKGQVRPFHGAGSHWTNASQCEKKKLFNNYSKFKHVCTSDRWVGKNPVASQKRVLYSALILQPVPSRNTMILKPVQLKTG